jgi:hypothetical protein
MFAQSAVRSMEPTLGLGDWQTHPFCRSYATCCCVCDSFFHFFSIVSILNSILIRLKNLRCRSMLVSGMSIVEGFLTIFLMSPIQFWAVFC